MELLKSKTLSRPASKSNGTLTYPKEDWSARLRLLLGLKTPTHIPSCPTGPAGAQEASSKKHEPPTHVEFTSPAATLQGPNSAVTSDPEHPNSAAETRSFSEHSDNQALSASNGANSEQSSADASIPSTATAPSAITSSISIPQAYECIENQGVFLARDMPIADEYQEAWKEISCRLKDALEHLFSPKSKVNHHLALEFTMAGRSPWMLKPSIILICCNEPHRKKLKKILKTQKWIAAYGYPCFVLVDPLEPLSGLVARESGQTPSVGGGTWSNAQIIGIALGIGSSVIIFIGLVALYWGRKDRKWYRTFSTSDDPTLGMIEANCRNKPPVHPRPPGQNTAESPPDSHDSSLHSTSALPGIRTTTSPMQGLFCKAGPSTEYPSPAQTVKEKTIDIRPPLTANFPRVDDLLVTPQTLTSPVDVVSSLSPTRSTLCGLLAYANIGESQQSVSFTIGGVIWVDDKPYGLTTSHSFVRNRKPPDSHAASFDMAETEFSIPSDSEDSSAHVAFHDAGEVSADTVSIRPETGCGYRARLRKSEERPTKPVMDSRGQLDRIGSIKNLDGWEASPSGTQQLDWALIQLTNPFHWLENTTHSTGPDESLHVTSILETDGFLDEEVLIIAGLSGTTAGRLRTCPVYIKLGGSFFEARQVLLDHALAAGDSGSWVVQNGQLCGHIVASQTVAPLAYMLPVEAIFKDIKLQQGAKNIRLSAAQPNVHEVDSQGSTDDSV